MDGHRISNLEHAHADLQRHVWALRDDVSDLKTVVRLQAFAIVAAWALAVVWLVYLIGG